MHFGFLFLSGGFQGTTMWSISKASVGGVVSNNKAVLVKGKKLLTIPSCSFFLSTRSLAFSFQIDNCFESCRFRFTFIAKLALVFC